MSKDNTNSTNSGASKSVVESWEKEKEVCSLYIDCAKSYVQLSTGALLLSLTFYKDILGIEKFSLQEGWPLLIMWVIWLIAILFGTLYQYCVVKYLEVIASDNDMLYYKRRWKWFIPNKWRQKPYILYGRMIAFFYAALFVFLIFALSKIF
jgi:hypothetical protein